MGDDNHLRRGQNLAELALLLPMLMLLLIGAVDLGRAFYTKVALTNAARTAAAYASNQVIALKAADPIQTVKDVAAREASPIPVTTTFTTNWATSAQYQVKVESDFVALTPLVSALWGGGPLTMSATTTMRHNCVATQPCTLPPAPSCANISQTAPFFGPILHHPNTGDTMHYTTAVWTTSTAAASVLQYTGPKAGSIAAGDGTSHSATVTMLPAGTYQFQVMSWNSCGQSVVGPWVSLTILS